MLDIQPLIRDFFALYNLDVANTTNRNEVITRCKNLVMEEGREFEEAMADYRRRQTRENRFNLAGEAADVRYVVNYSGYALDIPIQSDAPGYGATFERRLERTEWGFDNLSSTEPGSEEEESARIYLAMELSHLDVMVQRAAATEGSFNLDDVVTEVHAANMRKIWPDGTIHYREDGKVLKPPGWVPADIESVLFKPVDIDPVSA